MTPTDQPTPAEIRALRAYIAEGSARGAGRSLGLSESTIKGELASIRSKLGVHRTAQAALILREKLAA